MNKKPRGARERGQRVHGNIGGRKSQGRGPNSAGGLGNLRDVPANEQPDLFCKKLQLCMKRYDFYDIVSIENERGKMLKTSTLIELREAIQSQPSLLRENVIRQLMNMIEENLFRSMNRPRAANYNPDEDEPFQDPEFEHVTLVYELFVHFIESPGFHPNQMKRYIDQRFVLNMIDLFNSYDARERETLKTVLHRIYGKFLGLRGFIRKTINNVFLQFIFEDGSFNGIAELLEILGSIINGFAIPIKAEHKVFLSRVLIPLHKSPRYQSFQGQLAYCIVQFVEKDASLTQLIIGSILRYWPLTNTTKEVLFLSEVEEILDVCEPHEFINVCEPLFHRLALCVDSQHFQVAERALYFWNNEYIVSLIEENSSIIMPIVFMPLYDAARHHWNSTIVMLVCNVLKTLMEVNQELFDELAEDLLEEDGHGPDARETIMRAMTRAESMTTGPT